jgi:hypothetical protein
MGVKRQRGAKGKADDIFSEVIRSFGSCEAEGYAGRRCTNQLQAAHIITRGRSATRTDTRNAFSLCFGHHRFFHDYPREFSRFISGTWAQEYYDHLYEKSITPTKVNWQERVDFLKRIKDGEISIKEARSLEDA